MPKEEETKGITVKKSEDTPEWYGQVIIKSELADYAPVKGCMVIRPYGYAIWQKIMDHFNSVIFKKGVKNAYFPMFIPESFFKKEAEHAEGFNPEVAWIENKDENSGRLALRPTSETIMYESYSNWIRSWRDLPLRINQWCNIVRWEVSDVKLFLRSREFLWQEGHCVYESEAECDKETMMFLSEYENLCKDLLAMPVLKGKKTEKEKFAGAKYTTTIEGFMPDGKALQMGTSHNLGQGFADVFGIRYLGKDEKEHIPWQSSWGFSTRLIGGMVMTHSDDKGLVLPPNIAPVQIVIVPIYFKDKKMVLKEAKALAKSLKGFFVEVDSRDGYTPGYKFNEWELKGVPLRIEIGPRDIKNSQVVAVRRDNSEKIIVKIKDLNSKVKEILDSIHESLYGKAKKFLDSSIVDVDSWDSLVSSAKSGKMARAFFCGEASCEDEIKADTKGVSARCIPFGQKKEKGKCVKCGKDASFKVLFSRSY